MLKIKNLSAGYGGPDIIHNVNMEVNEGEIVTIIGPNGAGKSTILKTLFGFTKVSNGEVYYFGGNVLNEKTENIIKRGISYVPQGRTVFANLSVEENLYMGGYIQNDKNKLKNELHKVYERFPKLYERRNQVTKTLSGGEQQMVSIGRALMLEPELLLLDEPSIGLAPIIIQELFEKLEEIKKSGTSILMVEQNANIALQYSDRAYVLEQGENKYQGTGKDLLNDKKVGELYIGK